MNLLDVKTTWKRNLVQLRTRNARKESKHLSENIGDAIRDQEDLDRAKQKP